jgi:hypothetical protein
MGASSPRWREKIILESVVRRFSAVVGDGIYYMPGPPADGSAA